MDPAEENRRLREANERVSRLLMRARIELRNLSQHVDAKPKACRAGPCMPRPGSAVGTFLRIITVNDIYKLDRYPCLATAIKQAQAFASSNNCVTKSFLPGDFVGPCVLTAIDGGKAMVEALSVAGIDYCCLGNHEFDIERKSLAKHMSEYSGTCVNSNVANKELAFMPKYALLKVGDRDALITGVCTDTKSIFSPANLPDLTQPDEAIAQVWEKAKAELGRTPDLFIPMTHQLIAADRSTATLIAKHVEMRDVTPVVLGGHEHEVFVDESGRSTVVKTGLDIETIGFIDIWWTADGQMRKTITLVPADEFEPDPQCAKFVQRQNDFLRGMMETPIAAYHSPMSSTRVRFESSAVATFLLSLVKQGLQKDGVDLALIQGGSVRAASEYDVGSGGVGNFTMGHLFKEFAFPTQMAVVQLPGRLIAEAVRHTRSGPKPAPNFLHCDSGVVITAEPEHLVTHINGAVIDLDRMYRCALYVELLRGMDVVEPLMKYTQQQLLIDSEFVPDEEACVPVKVRGVVCACEGERR
jgi:2',3'-cyclic-nucleotide 2'-phosphodiesterase (5'-nucleotidase family)